MLLFDYYSGTRCLDYGLSTLFYYYRYLLPIIKQWLNMENTVTRGYSLIPHVKRLGLVFVAPPYSTLVFIILMLLDHGCPNLSN